MLTKVESEKELRGSRRKDFQRDGVKDGYYAVYSSVSEQIVKLKNAFTSCSDLINILIYNAESLMAEQNL